MENGSSIDFEISSCIPNMDTNTEFNGTNQSKVFSGSHFENGEDQSKSDSSINCKKNNCQCDFDNLSNAKYFSENYSISTTENLENSSENVAIKNKHSQEDRLSKIIEDNQECEATKTKIIENTQIYQEATIKLAGNIRDSQHTLVTKGTIIHASEFTTESDCSSQCLSDWGDKKSSTDSLDWSSSCRGRTSDEKSTKLRSQQMEQKLFNDISVGIAGSVVGSVPANADAVSASGNDMADANIYIDDRPAPPPLGHKSECVSDWKYSLKVSNSSNMSSDSLHISGTTNSNVINETGFTDNINNSLMSADNISDNKSLDSLQISENGKSSRDSLVSVGKDYSTDDSIGNISRHGRLSADPIQKAIRSITKSSSQLKHRSKLREWKSRTNVSCDIDWSEFNNSETEKDSAQSYLNSSCDILDRLSMNQDDFQPALNGSSRSTDSVFSSNRHQLSQSSCDEARTRRMKGLQCNTSSSSLDQRNDSNSFTAVTSGGHNVCDANYPRTDASYRIGSSSDALIETLEPASLSSIHRCSSEALPHTPVTPKSSQHSLFSNSTPNSMSMTPSSLSPTSDSLLDTPDSLSNTPHFCNKYNSLTNVPTSSHACSSTYSTTPKSLPHTPHSYSNQSSSYSNTPDSYKNPPHSSNNTPDSYNNPTNSYSNTPNSYVNDPSSTLNTPNSFSVTKNSYSSTSNSYTNTTPNSYSKTPNSYSTPPGIFTSNQYSTTPHSTASSYNNAANSYAQNEPYSSTSFNNYACTPVLYNRGYLSPPPSQTAAAAFSSAQEQYTAELAAAGITGNAANSSSSTSNNTNDSSNAATATEPSASTNNSSKGYDYLLKFLLVGDSDVGKHEILAGLEDGAAESPYCVGSGHKSTIILLDGKRVKLQLWDTSGQGRFCTIIRSYSRGAQGILLVYDITNKWSFEGLDRWMGEIQEHAPGVPKVLLGNRLHLAFKRQVSQSQAEQYAARNRMSLFEVSPLCDFNVVESFTELSRLALKRNGMERLWRANKVLSLQELCSRTIVAATSVYGIERLPLPPVLRSHLKSYTIHNHATRLRQGIPVTDKHKKKHMTIPGDCSNNKNNSSSCVNTSTCCIT